MKKDIELLKIGTQIINNDNRFIYKEQQKM